jgi:predicted transposase YbfD/YdcC
MDAKAPCGALRFFRPMNDPREKRGIRHRLPDMIAIAITAVICNADGWEDIEIFGKCKAKWFATFLDLPHGVPSHDTFARVFAKLDPDEFESCFRQWMAHLGDTSQGRLIAVDGKTLRHSFDTASEKTALHMINAWCTTNQSVLGQMVCGTKENEIPVLPRLLKLLDLDGAVVTADAMHCQKKTAKVIRQGKGDYLLQVKDNQPSLHENIELLFEQGLTDDCRGVRYDFSETTEAGHGRIETRRCWCSDDIVGVAPSDDWPGLKTVVCVERIRRIGSETTRKRHYYISSLPADAKTLLRCSRNHWGVENQLHWRMDVVFHEDARRIRKDHAAENYTRLSRIALNLLKADTSVKASIRQKRKLAGWDHDFLLNLIALET